MFADITGINILFVLVSLVVGLTLHEAMHGFAAHLLGDDTAHREGRLTLNPLAHIDVLTTIVLPMVMIMLHVPPILAAKPVPFNPERLKWDEYGAALVGLAGPFTNLVLAAVAALIFRMGSVQLDAGLSDFLITFTAMNIGIFVFNLIPFPPLDGSRVLYVFAPDPLRRVMDQIEAAGFLFLLAIILIGFQFIAGPITNIQEALLKFLLL